MKKLLYILLALPLLTACREKKETAGAAAMYTPEVSVASNLSFSQGLGIKSVAPALMARTALSVSA